jgi:AcrR family transcriptional regulator
MVKIFRQTLWTCPADANHVKAIYMSTSKRRPGRRGYHHGNLSEALVQAALDLIAEFGPAGFTFAEVTRAVGVSPAAPYRHFRDRDALMADIARRGFERFAAELESAWNDGRPDALAAFKNVGQAYLAFARDEPAYYSAMFEARLPPDADRDLASAADRAFAVLRRASEALIADAPEGRRPPALMMSLHVWAMSHGIASLFGRGDEARRKVPMSPEDLLEAGILVYLDGLGLGISSRDGD